MRRIDTAGVITTIAGTGEDGFSGDGGPATEAALSYPAGVATDGAGNVYVAGNHRVRRIDSAGVISTFAGTGEDGFSGDGGPATEAALSYPITVAVDGAGNVYVADYGSNRVRRIDTAGVISTFAGTGEAGFSGDGGPATEAQFDVGHNDGFLFVATDAAGNVYVTDAGNHRVRRVDTIEGTPPPPPGPELVARADFNSNLVVDFADFITFAGAFGSSVGGAGFDARVDLDDSGTVDFADFLTFAQLFGVIVG